MAAWSGDKWQMDVCVPLMPLQYCQINLYRLQYI